MLNNRNVVMERQVCTQTHKLRCPHVCVHHRVCGCLQPLLCATSSTRFLLCCIRVAWTHVAPNHSAVSPPSIARVLSRPPLPSPRCVDTTPTQRQKIPNPLCPLPHGNTRRRIGFCVVQCSVVSCCVVLCRVVLYCTVLYMLCCVVWCCNRRGTQWSNYSAPLIDE